MSGVFWSHACAIRVTKGKATSVVKYFAFYHDKPGRYLFRNVIRTLKTH